MGKKRRKRKTLGEPGGKKNFAGTLQSESAKPLGIIAGLAAGAAISAAIDKVMPPSADAASAGKFNIKKLVKPVILLAGGAVVAFATTPKPGEKNWFKSFANLGGYGLIGGGIISGTKVFLKRDLFALGDPDETQIGVLNETKRKVQKLLTENTHKLNLPELGGGELLEDGTMGFMSPTLEYENMQQPI